VAPGSHVAAALMKILIFGGTGFVGRHIVDAAVHDNHEVTRFNKELSNPRAFPDVEQIIGSRSKDIRSLLKRHWDAVIDVCGYVPRDVWLTAGRLRRQIPHYTFISSTAVYRGWDRGPRSELSATFRAMRGPESTANAYGRCKVACERVVRHFYPRGSLIIRPGLIQGPYDGRFAYWPARIAAGGQIIAPGSPDRLVQLIDARDLATWIVRLVAARKVGVFNACGPLVSVAKVIHTYRKVIGGDAELTWVSDSFLKNEGVHPNHLELPLWTPWDDVVNTERAKQRGLVCRPLRKTALDVCNWISNEGLRWPRHRRQAQDSRRKAVLYAGLSPKRERELLLRWRRGSDMAGPVS